MEFKKVVQYTGSKHLLLQYPLSTGESMFSAGVDYVITSKKDFHRLMQSNVFKDVTPTVAAPVIEEAPIDLVEDVPTPKRERRDAKKETN